MSELLAVSSRPSATLKIVELDSKARVRRVVKHLAKEMGTAKNLTFVIERKDGKSWYCNSTHEDDATVASVLEQVAAFMRLP